VRKARRIDVRENQYCPAKAIENANSFAESIDAFNAFQQTFYARAADGSERVFGVRRRSAFAPLAETIDARCTVHRRLFCYAFGEGWRPCRQALSGGFRKGSVVEKRRSNIVLQQRARPNTFWLDTLSPRP
jgi:hypothetical protein